MKSQEISHLSNQHHKHHTNTSMLFTPALFTHTVSCISHMFEPDLRSARPPRPHSSLVFISCTQWFTQHSFVLYITSLFIPSIQRVSPTFLQGHFTINPCSLRLRPGLHPCPSSHLQPSPSGRLLSLFIAPVPQYRLFWYRLTSSSPQESVWKHLNH